MRALGRLALAAVCALGAFGAVAQTKAPAHKADAAFVIAVIPDTQNYIDFDSQRAEGFPIDAREAFLDQMSFVRRNLVSQGGEIAFVTAVGDVWQHPSRNMDAAHTALGLKADISDAAQARFSDRPGGVNSEMAVARAGYAMIASESPFSVSPGNHDYDAFWVDPRSPPPGQPSGQLHYGGLDNFRSVFGAQSPLFKARPWYAASFNGGADSAQIFEAGGYRFLHIGLEMAPADDVLAWASGVVARHKGLPTIVTIHDHLNPAGERLPIPVVDFKAVHPGHNNPEDLWTKFLSKQDQIFMVFSGHQNGQSRRVDTNAFGHKVWQMLSDYQNRDQALKAFDPDHKLKAHGFGDGWMRLARFDLAAAVPAVRVRAYSTYYHAYANELPTYAAWYRPAEKPQVSDEAFLAEEDFTLVLDDFRARFGAPRSGR